MFDLFDSDDAAAVDRFRRLATPQIDQSVRQAISTCRMILPKERQNADEVEKEIRRVVDRALLSFREDASSFGLPTS